MPRLPERRVVAHPHHLYVAWSALCNLQLDFQKGTVCSNMCFPNFSLTWAKEQTVDVFVLCQNPSLRSPDRLAFASQNDEKWQGKRAMSGHVSRPPRRLPPPLPGKQRTAKLDAQSRAEPSKQKTTRRSFRLGWLGWRMLKTCITRNSNREALATIWLGASIHRFTRGQAFDWKVQGIVKGSWSYMLLSRVKIPKKYYIIDIVHCIIILEHTRYLCYFLPWGDIERYDGMLVDWLLREKEMKKLRQLQFDSSFLKWKSRRALWISMFLTSFWQLDYMYLIWSILKVRLIHWCLQPRTRCSGTTSKGEWQLKPESCANLRRKKSREGVL